MSRASLSQPRGSQIGGRHNQSNSNSLPPISSPTRNSINASNVSLSQSPSQQSLLSPTSPSSHVPITLQPTNAISAAGLTYDFELRSSPASENSPVTPVATNTKGNRTLSSSASTSSIPTFPRPMLGNLAGRMPTTRYTNTAALARKSPGTLFQSNSTSSLHSSPIAGSSPLPSHLQTSGDKIDFFLNWNKSWGNAADGGDGANVLDPASSAGGSESVSGILTPRTRYDRLAQSVAAIPFDKDKDEERKESRNEDIKPGHKLNRTQALLSSSASSPALLSHVQDLTPHELARSLSNLQLPSNAPGLSASTSTASLLSPSLLRTLPPSDFLSVIFPDDAFGFGLGLPVHYENKRAKLMEEKYARAYQQKKRRKKEKRDKRKREKIALGLLNRDGTPKLDSEGNIVAGAEDSNSSSGDDSDHELTDLVTVDGKKRKPGTQAGANIISQIHAIVRAVHDEKDAGSKSKNRREQHADDDSDEDEGPKANALQGTTNPQLRTTAAETQQQMSVIQQYMDSTGLSGTVAAGGSSGGGTIHNRDGTSTFTTAKITRDVKLVLDYLKTNPVLRAELYERIQKRKIEKREKAKAEGRYVPQDIVRQNQIQVWEQTSENKAARRKEAAIREKERIERAQDNKQQIDLIWLRRAAARDAAVMHRYGPEMEARRLRENAENDRLAHCQWGWLMFAHLIPITTRFKWKLKEILLERLTKQVESFVVPMVKRNYVTNLTAQLNATRAEALIKIKRIMVRYVRRWKWIKRRTALLGIWKFFTLVKNAYCIRQGLKDSSLRSQIIKIQTWWRQQLHVIACQIGLVELKWTQRENFLIKNWTRKQKAEERRKAGAHEGQYAIGHHSPTKQKKNVPTHLMGATGKFARTKQSGSDFQHTLASFDFNNSSHGHAPPTGEDDIERDAQQGLAPKRIPKSQKHDLVSKYVKKRRAQFRAAVRGHVHVLQAWHDEHKHEIELRKARQELGIKNKQQQQHKDSHAAAAAAAAKDALLEPPHRPTLRLLPSNTDLDHQIMAASKAYVLSKLRGAMSGEDLDVAAASLKVNQQPVDTFNPLTNYIPGNIIHTPTKLDVPLKSLTIGEKQMNKRELLEKHGIQHSVTEENEEDEED